jgi:hypothetical protein
MGQAVAEGDALAVAERWGLYTSPLALAGLRSPLPADHPAI